MEDSLERQLALADLIDNFDDNTRRVGRENLNAGYLRARLELLGQYWSDFQQNHQTLLGNRELSEDAYFTKGRYDEIELSFSMAVGALYDRMAQLPSTAIPLPTPDAPTRQSSRPTHLPNVPLPRFSGRLEDWEPFRDLFRSLVHNDPTLSGVQKLHFLMSSVDGSAKRAVHGIEITEANYTIAWNLLVSRFDNPQLRIYQHMEALASIKPMKGETGSGLQELHDLIARHREALRTLGLPVDTWDRWFIFFATRGMDPTTRREWEKRSTESESDLNYHSLHRFLQDSARTLRTIEVSITKKDREIDRRTEERSRGPRLRSTTEAIKSREVLSTTPRNLDCPVCKRHHHVVKCDEFGQLTVSERRQIARRDDLCFGCLEPGHCIRNCETRDRCTRCHAAHHSLLHEEGLRKRPSLSRPVSSQEARNKKPRTGASETTEPTQAESPRLNPTDSPVLLASAQVLIRRTNQRPPLRARVLIDPGSEVNLTSTEFVRRVRCILEDAHVPLAGIGGKIFNTACRSANLNLLPHTRESTSLTAKVLVLPHLGLSTARKPLDEQRWTHLCELRLADPNFGTSGPVDILLGAEAYANVIREGLRRGPEGSPTAQNSTLGWLVFGGTGVTSPSIVSITRSAQNDPIDTLLERFWRLEASDNSRLMTVDEQHCEQHFLKHPKQLPAPGSLAAARRALLRVQTKMDNDLEYRNRYKEFMHEDETFGHIEPVEPSDLSPQHPRVSYLPHHGIWQTADQSTKLRVVFNASCKIGGKLSLNDCLHTGPPLQSDLSTIISRWRLHRIAVGTDIEKMYRQIRVHPHDTDLQRIVWQSSEGREKHLRLLTVTYGLNCAPYLALRVLRQLAQDEANNFPRAALLIKNDSYVDDILFGADDITTA